MSFKKPLLISITLFLGVMGSLRAKADTNYNFSFIDTGGYPGASITGVFGVDGLNVIKTMTGTVSGFASNNGSISGLLPTGTHPYYNNNLYNPTTVVDYSGLVFYTGVYTSNVSLNTFALSLSSTFGGSNYYYVNQITACFTQCRQAHQLLQKSMAHSSPQSV